MIEDNIKNIVYSIVGEDEIEHLEIEDNTVYVYLKDGSEIVVPVIEEDKGVHGWYLLAQSLYTLV